MLTQREFAHRFGFSLDVIKSWESGRRIPDQTAAIFLFWIGKDPQLAAKRVVEFDRQQIAREYCKLGAKESRIQA